MAKVLLVEDNKSLRELYSKHLRDINFEVETAGNGKEALAKVNEFKPDAIVLDIILPEINGIEVLKILKADPEHRKIPVLMLTGFSTHLSESNKLRECLENGAQGYILKEDYASAKKIASKINLLLDLLNRT